MLTKLFSVTTVTCSNDKMSLALIDDGSYETIHLEDVSDKGMSISYNIW